MKKIAQDICDILHDYHKKNGFEFTSDLIMSWVSQFDAGDQLFLLEEFLHLLKQDIYISEEKGKELLLRSIKELTVEFKFSKISEFLKNVDFLRLQKNAGNSQGELLEMLDEALFENYGVRLSDCGKKSKKYAIYIDDIFATGNTAYSDLMKWLVLKSESGETNLDDVMKGIKEIVISAFCLHSWPSIGWRLKKNLGRDLSDKIIYRWDYKIENHPTLPGQRFNFAYPVKNNSKEVVEYLQNLQIRSKWPMTKMEYAMRSANIPLKETFFSSSANRVRFENIILLKGIEILGTVKVLNDNQRPMGNINPSFQTLGTGSLFFTWRNISNTTPVVFWWESKHWQCLFPVANRG